MRTNDVGSQSVSEIVLGRNMRTHDEEIARHGIEADFASKIEVVHELSVYGWRER